MNFLLKCHIFINKFLLKCQCFRIITSLTSKEVYLCYIENRFRNRNHLSLKTNKILLIDGARQVGKTFIIRHVGKKMYDNFIEINMIEDRLQNQLFKNVKTVEDFLSSG